MGPTKIKNESSGIGGSGVSSGGSPGSVPGSSNNNPGPQVSKAKGAGKGKTKLLGGLKDAESIEMERRKLQSQLDRVRALKSDQATERYVDLRNASQRKPEKKKAPKKPAKPNQLKTPFQKKISIRKKMQTKLKHPFQLIPRVVKVREALEKGLGVHPKSARATILERRKRRVMLKAMEGVHKLESSLNKKVQMFSKPGKRNGGKIGLSKYRANMTKNQMLDGIVKDLENDKIFENQVAYAYLCALLNPEKYKNIGIPDSFNAARSGKPTIITEYIIPFDSNHEAAIIVSDDPLAHITVLKGGSASQTIAGPIWGNANETSGASNNWVAIISGSSLVTSAITSGSPVVASGSATFKVDAGKVRNLPLWYVNDTYTPVPLNNIQIDSKEYNFLPAAAGDTFTVALATTDTTAAGYTMTLQNVHLINGEYSIVPQGPTNVQGGAVVTGFAQTSFTLPANCVGVYSYNITNAAAGTDAVPNCQVFTTLVKALGQITLPCGKANGDDVNFIIDYCDEYRSGPCSVLSTYYGGYLENGLIIQGQLPKDDDFELPPPSVQDWGLIPGVVTKPLNDPTDPGAYTAMIRRDITSSQWDTLNSEDEDTNSHEQVIIYVKANSDDAEFVRIRTALQFQYRTEVQSVYTDEGAADDDAIDLVTNWLMEHMNGFAPTFGNCDHDEKCDKVLQDFEKYRGGTTVSFFNGWFSGNDTKLSNDGEIIA